MSRSPVSAPVAINTCTTKNVWQLQLIPCYRDFTKYLIQFGKFVYTKVHAFRSSVYHFYWTFSRAIFCLRLYVHFWLTDQRLPTDDICVLVLFYINRIHVHSWWHKWDFGAIRVCIHTYERSIVREHIQVRVSQRFFSCWSRDRRCRPVNLCGSWLTASNPVEDEAITSTHNQHLFTRLPKDTEILSGHKDNFFQR